MVVLVSHHPLERILHQSDLPLRCGVHQLLSFFWYEGGQDLLGQGSVLVFRVEDALDFDVSKALVKVDRKIHLACLTLALSRADNNVTTASL